MWQFSYAAGVVWLCLIVAAWAYYGYMQADKGLEVTWFALLHGGPTTLMTVILPTGEELSVLGAGRDWQHLTTLVRCDAELSVHLEKAWRKHYEDLI